MFYIHLYALSSLFFIWLLFTRTVVHHESCIYPTSCVPCSPKLRFPICGMGMQIQIQDVGCHFCSRFVKEDQSPCIPLSGICICICTNRYMDRFTCRIHICIHIQIYGKHHCVFIYLSYYCCTHIQICVSTTVCLYICPIIVVFTFRYMEDTTVCLYTCPIIVVLTFRYV